MIGHVLDGIGVALGLVLLGIVILGVRRWLLQRRGGTFDCSLRLREGESARGWALGLGRYSGDVVQWFRVFSLAPSPRRVFARSELVVRARRSPLPSEAVTLYAGHVVVECQVNTEAVELAMAEDALTGFLAWLEAAPPGRAFPREQA